MSDRVSDSSVINISHNVSKTEVHTSMYSSILYIRIFMHEVELLCSTQQQMEDHRLRLQQTRSKIIVLNAKNNTAGLLST